MKKYTPQDFKHFKVHYPNGSVSEFSIHKSASLELAEKVIAKLLTIMDHKTGKAMKPVKIRRYK